MRKNAAKIAALMLGAAMALTACGGGQSTGNGGGNTSAGGNAGSGSSTQAEESDKNAIMQCLANCFDPDQLKIVKASQLVSFLPGYHTFMEAQALHFTQALPNALHTAQLTRQAHFTDSR